MSSRALRKALRARELAALSQNPPPAEEEEESEDDVSPPPQKPSLFALLGDDDGDGDGDGDDDNIPDPKDEDDEDDEEASQDEEPVIPTHPDPAATSKKKKKKKKKAKSKPVPPEREDEIDAALRQLDLEQPVAAEADTGVGEQKSLCEVLKIDARNFDAANEMRRLFGRAALDSSDDPGVAVGPARVGGLGRERGGGAPKGRRLMGRRNLFVQAKEEWPVATSGGLGMELVSSGLDGTIEFRFVHSLAYRDIQRQFMMCVASMGTIPSYSLLLSPPRSHLKL